MKNFFLFLSLFFPIFLIGQTIDVRFDGGVTNMDLGKKEAGFIISIVQGGSTISSATTSSNGKYSLKGKVDPNKPYDVVFSKSGFVSKKINFDLKGINIEDIPAGDFKPIESLDLELFANKPGLDFSFLNTQPVGKFTWDQKGFLNMDQNAKKAVADRIDKLLQEASQGSKDNDVAYNNAVQAADKAYNEKDYKTAMSKYEEALRVPGKGQEKHPNNRIIEIDDIIQKQKQDDLKFQQENAAYVNLIKAADNLFNAGDYVKAKEKYNEAIDLNEDEQYPRDQINAIAKKVKEKDNEDKYKKLIEAADIMYKQKSFKAARDNYAEALKLKENEQYPKDKLKELDDKIKAEDALAANKQKYDELVAQGEQLVKEEKWEDAKTKFQEALAIEKASTYVQGQIVTIDKKLLELKAEKDKLEKIEKLLAEGEKAKNEKTYDIALAKFKEVVGLDKENSVAPTKITEIEQILADEAKNKDLNDKFNAFVKQGDDAVTAKKFQDAITKYTEALNLKGDLAVTKKKEDAEKELQNLAKAEENEANFKKLIEEAQTALTAKEYEASLTKFQAALEIKPTDEPTKKKIEDVKKLITDKQSASDLQTKIEKLLQDGISLMEGSLVDGPQLESAKNKFNEVLALDSKNTTAKDRITQIDKLLASQKEQSDKDLKFKELVTNGDSEAGKEAWEKAIGFYNSALGIKDDPDVKAKITLAQEKINSLADAKKIEENYQKAIKEADVLRDSKKYTDAIAKYEQAKSIKQADEYPQKEIEKINIILANDKSAAEKKQQIDNLLAEGENLFSKKEFVNAKDKFTLVQGLDPANATAKKRIEEIDLEIAKIAGETEKAQKIAGLIAEGEQLFTNSQYENSEVKFKEVLVLDKTNATATKYLADIAKKLNDQKSLAETKQKFDDLVKKGDESTASEKWEAAILAYNDALKIENNITVVQKRDLAQQKLGALANEKEINSKYNEAINEANKLRDSKKYNEALSKYNEAKVLKPSETLPQIEIDKINQVLASLKSDGELKLQIDNLLSEGKTAFTTKDYSNAKSKYQAVINLDNANEIAKKQLIEIAKIEESLEKEQNEAKTSEEFNRLKNQGFTEALAKEWVKAKHSLEEALKIKSDAEVTKKLDEIKKQINDNTNAEKLELEYKALTDKAQLAEASKDYTSAIDNYSKALNLKSSEQLKNKIEELKKLQSQQSLSQEIDKKYNELIAKGDELVAQQDYSSAIKKFNEALGLKPSEMLPVNKAKEAERLAADQKNSEQDAAFEKVITAINTKIAENDFKKAKEYISTATSLRPNDPRPAQLAAKIDSIEKENIAFADFMDKAQKAESKKNYLEAIGFYEKAKAVKNSHPEPIAKIDSLRLLVADVSSASEKEKLYKQYFDLGVSKQLSKEYDVALTNYKNALNVKPNDPKSIQKIGELEGLIAKQNADSQSKQDAEAKYNKLITEADGLFSNKDYSNAIDIYKKALIEKPDNAYIKKQINEAEKLIAQESNYAKTQEYQKVIETADNYFNSKDYSKAMEYYNKAIALKNNNDLYAQGKIEQINNLLNPITESSAELHSLGDPFDGSILDGEVALKAAEAERKDSKRNKLKQANDQSIIANNEITAAKKAEMEATIGNIYSLYSTMIEKDKLKGADKIEITSKIHVTEQSNYEVNKANTVYEANSIAQTQDLLTSQKEKVQTDFDNSSKAQQENHIEIDKVRTLGEDVKSTYSVKKYDENISTDVNLVTLKEKTQQNAENSSKAQQENHIEIDKVRTLGEDVKNTYSVKKYDENISTDVNLVTLKEKTQQNAENSSKAQQENHIEIDKVRTLGEDVKNTYSKETYDRNLSTDTELTGISKKVEENNIESTADKIGIAKEVDTKREYAENKNADRSDVNYEEAVNNKEIVEKVITTVSKKDAKNAELLSNNTIEIKKIETNINDKNAVDNSKKYHESVGVDDEMKNLKITVSNNEIEKDVSIIASKEYIKETAKEIENRETEKINQNALKNNDTKTIIEKQDIRKQANDNLAAATHIDKVKDVAIVEASTANAFKDLNRSDKEERLYSQSELDLKKDDLRQRDLLEKERLKEKGESVKETSKVLSTNSTAKSNDKTNSIYSTKQEIEKAETSKSIEKVIVPNSLGEKYPEGVSQEMFQRKDDAGILSAIITRRIVVIQGRGNEYVRTQTSHAITYTKNGSPTTEHVWQNETQDAKLQRNY